VSLNDLALLIGRADTAAGPGIQAARNTTKDQKDGGTVPPIPYCTFKYFYRGSGASEIEQMELSPMSKLLRSFQALALLELIAFAGVAMAQQDGSWCGPAEASLRSAARGDTYHRAIRDLVGCPVSGPQALAAQWAHPPEDTVALQILGDACATLRRSRLLRAATSAALNTSNRREVRLTA